MQRTGNINEIVKRWYAVIRDKRQIVQLRLFQKRNRFLVFVPDVY